MSSNLTPAENLAQVIQQVARKARSEHTSWYRRSR
jgi:hypothetical protein